MCIISTFYFIFYAAFYNNILVLVSEFDLSMMLHVNVSETKLTGCILQ